MRIPKVLMVMAGNSGTAYWRMYSWWEAAHRTGKGYFHVLGWDKHIDGMSPWQIDIGDPQMQPELFGKLFNAALEADIVVFQRCETKWALAAFHALKDQFPTKPILSEIDDDIFDVAPYNPASWTLRPGSHLTGLAIEQFSSSDGLIVSTPYLKEVYSPYNEHIHVVPNSIDTQRWDRQNRKKRGGIRIGWIGSASHGEDIKILDSVIDPIVKANKDAQFVFVTNFGENGEYLPAFLKDRSGVQIVSKWEPIMRYPAHLANQDFDIGLAPLVDNKFNRGKSNLRWLEYSALGIPCVASNVGHFAETVRHGEDGFLCDTPSAFVTHIQSLISDRKLRRQIGAAARARIGTDFNIDRNIDLYIGAIEDALSRPAKAAPSLVSGVDDMKFVAEQELGPLEVNGVPMGAS